MSIFCCCLVTQLCPTLLQPHGLKPTRHLCPWDFPGKNAGVDCHLLLQEIFLTQGSNFCLLHWLVDSLPLTYTHRTWEKRGVRGRILVTKFFIEVCNSFYMIQFLIWKKILTVIRTYTIKWREMNMGIVIHLFILKKSSLINFYYQRYV